MRRFLIVLCLAGLAACGQQEEEVVMVEPAPITAEPSSGLGHYGATCDQGDGGIGGTGCSEETD